MVSGMVGKISGKGGGQEQAMKGADRQSPALSL
jgi:hypothetical protein